MEIECQLDVTDGFFIADLIACSTCFGHHYVHHQELKSIIQGGGAARGIWCFGFQVVGLVWSCGFCAAASRKPDTKPTRVAVPIEEKEELGLYVVCELSEVVLPLY